MKVETYETTVEVHPEACDEAARLIEELGLRGQRASVNEDGSRLPYRQWNKTECEVFSLLLPTRESVFEYEAESMPLRVLQVLAHAKSLGVFEGFEVWHNANPAVKDPVLVGYMPNQSWQIDKRYILARWGDELDDMPALVEKAARIKALQIKAKAEEIIGKMRALIARVDAAERPTLDLPMPWIQD